MSNHSFKYTLDKSAKKFVCPACGKRRLVKYVHTTTGGYLAGVFGRCERIESCKYFQTPPSGDVGYFMPCKSISDHSPKAYRITNQNFEIQYIPKSQVLEKEAAGLWVKGWYCDTNGISTATAQSKVFNDGGGVVNPVVTVSGKTREVKPSYHAPRLMEGIVNGGIECNLTKYLKTKFDAGRVRDAMLRYNTGGTNAFWENATCFFQVDTSGKVRAGKVIQYSAATGKRVKEPYPHINWMHNHGAKTEFNLSQSLYGLHLSESEPNNPVMCCESEKSSLVMSLLDNSGIWMACGSKTGIKAELFAPLKGRTVILYPDKGSAADWKLKADELNAKGFKIVVSEFVENQKQLPHGADIADLYI
ncbi:DUF6371 domain-containing protein [Pricia sp.]|uniref:DUF6371 domain-containing protein n=1 Tax=Pricia sp. TaxID=2268138 RepID=UPI0035943218